MSNTEDHLDINDLKKEGRKGWFVKAADDMPAHKKYATACKQGGRGFLGPNFGAHHIIPQEAIDKSAAGYDPEYIEDVKYITPFILNRPSNMVGLPSFWSYDVYYEATGTASHYPGNSAAWQASYPDTTRGLWTSWIQKSLAGKSRRRNPNPESHPIHLPVSWGHLEYTDQVTKRLEQQVWKIVGRKRKEHISKEALASIEAQLKAIESSFYTKLTTRGATSLQLWERRKNPDDDGWYRPFTMADISKNPIWG